MICNIQYGNGDFAPGINEGETGKWNCGHNLLLSHATAVKVYRWAGGRAGAHLLESGSGHDRRALPSM